MPGSLPKAAQRNPFRQFVSTAPPGEEMAEVRLLPLALIDPNPYQSRQVFSASGLEELAQSIREHGVIEPIVVRKVEERYEIVAGERRYKAASIAEQESIPARIMELDDTAAAIITALENLQREDLDIEDEARQFSYLLSVTGLSQRKLAEHLGVHFNYLSRRVRLLKRPDLMEQYRSGKQTLHGVLASLDAQPGGAAAEPGTEPSEQRLTEGEQGEADTEFELIERDDLPGFIVSRGYTMRVETQGQRKDSDRRSRARFRWRPLQQFHGWVARTHVVDVPPDERASLQAQLTEIKEALEKQIAELAKLQGVAPQSGAPAAGEEDAPNRNPDEAASTALLEQAANSSHSESSNNLDSTETPDAVEEQVPGSKSAGREEVEHER